MTNSRVNYFSRYMPDSYGNSYGTNIPKKSVTTSANSIDTGKLSSNANNLRSNALDYKNSQIKTHEEKSVLDNTDKLASDTTSTATNISKSLKADNKAGAIAAGASLVGNVVGTEMENKKKEVGGGIVKGIVSGGSTGLAVGGPWGALIGGVVGGVAGGLVGNKKKKARIAKEKETATYNNRMSKLYKKSLSQADDLDAYRNILSAKKGGVIKYQSGGILKYNSIDVDSAIDYLDSITPQPDNKPLSSSNIFNFKDTNSGLIKTNTIISNVPLLRRGGSIDIEKKNVIVDGPSHDEYNSTGVKKDKGLPIVKKGKKVAEIESLELVMNSKSASKLKSLVKEFEKTQDEKIKEQIGSILSSEFKDNTYDYSNLLD